VRIAFDIAALGRGGAERQVLDVSAGLRERGHEVLLIVNKTAPEYDEHAERVTLTELHRVGRFDARVLSGIRRTLAAFRPDVCVCVTFNASLWGRLAAASLRCPVVVAEHATRAMPAPIVRATNLALRGVTRAVIACSEAQVASLVREGHPEERIHVVRNGVDTEWFVRDEAAGAGVRRELGIPAGAAVVTLVAAHRPEKRHDRFIAVIEQLHAGGVEAWGLMVGGGPLMEHTVELARASTVAGWLRVTGPRTDLTAVYSAADVVVLVTDVAESFPLCFIEAQACGVPVVGPDTGGVAETMIPGETGLVVDLAGPEDMCSVLGALLTDAGLRTAMGSAACEFVRRNLSRDAMVSGYEAVLQSALHAGRGPV
jgi:glycosyltransferase involved in cell wall biosynthesis